MNATLLIVDDDRSACEPLAKALCREGYEVLLAHNGLQAFELYQRQLPDLVLVALNMRRQNGWDILEKISPLDPLTPPIIVISGWPDQLGSTVAACAGALLARPPEAPLFALPTQAVRRLTEEHAPKGLSWRRYGVFTRSIPVPKVNLLWKADARPENQRRPCTVDSPRNTRQRAIS